MDGTGVFEPSSNISIPTLRNNPHLSKDVDRLLSRELQSLSVQDRNKIQEEIHGLTNLCPEETPDLKEQALLSMQEHLDSISPKPIYDLVSPSSYIHSQEFRLSFLRCELFDCKRAAERLVRFTEYMEQEYDIEVLERPLRLEDLRNKCGSRGKDTMDCLKSGHCQLLPFRDRSGRRIMTFHYNVMSYDAVLRFKIYDYLLLVANKDRETQRNGMVTILWGKAGFLSWPDSEELDRATRMTNSLPTRMAAMHISFMNTPILHLARAIVALTLQGKGDRTRILLHPEDDWEIRYKLLGYGIPIDLLPYTGTNNIKTKNFYQWMKGRKFMEQLEEEKRINNDSTPHNFVECPALADVVFKTGSSNISHPGNAVFREMLCEYFGEGMDDSPVFSSSHNVVGEIVQDVKQRGGGFLEWKSCGCWELVEDPSQLRNKVYNSLIYFKRTSEARKRMQVNASSTHIFERQDGKKRKRFEDGCDPC